MHATCYIRGAHIVDPAAGRSEVGDLYIRHGHVAPLPPAPPGDVGIIEAHGLVLTPGLLDIHVHLREPGGEAAETIETGSRAAAVGGFTRVVAMPNTTPPIDTPERVIRVLDQGARCGHADVMTTACLTQGREGAAVAGLRALAEAGAIAFTDDGATVQSDEVMRAAMQEAAELGTPVMDHAQDRRIELEGGVMHEGAVSARHGLPGIPTEAEARIIGRDIALAAETGCRTHIQHVSSARGVALLREAQSRGLPVTGEATPHHLALCDEDIDPSDADYKMNPPLRTAADRAAIRAALIDGTLCAFATDHAPHPAERKALGFREGPFGLVGLETAVGVTYTELVHTRELPLETWVARWTTGPASVLAIEPPALREGRPADLALFDFDSAWVVEPERFASRSRNTPFKQRRLHGRAVLTLARGRVTWQTAPSLVR